ncbi:MAG: hypothetical protein PUF66_01980 [Clostridium sp.]|nr:hypothetical protein [Clostridium sp.]
MKISKNLKENAVYLQKKDVIYLKHILSVSFVDDNKLKDYDLNDFILVEGEENVKLITSRDEILEFKDFLSMTKRQAEQRMDDAEQLLYIVKKKKAHINEVLRYRYMYSSAVDEFLEKERGTLSFSVPLALDMLSNYLFYDNDGTYYAASTTLPSTYEIGRIDGKKVDTNDSTLEKFVNVEMTTARDLENSSNDSNITRTRNVSKKKLYYTINRKK